MRVAHLCRHVQGCATFLFVNDTQYVARRCCSMFACVEQARLMPIVVTKQAFSADQFKDKVDMIVGAYRTEEGKPWVLPFVKKIEDQIVKDPEQDHEYVWFLGMEKFTKTAPRLILGEQNPAIKQGRAFGIQTLSGCGALRVGGEFLVRHLKYKTIYFPDPTWENHKLTFPYGGFTDIRSYRYWHAEKKGLDFEGLIEDLRAAPENAVIVLHVCAHNPTGCDPTPEQWMEIAKVMKDKHLFPFFDAAYQGFATGDLDKDAWPVRYFVEKGFELFVAQSFSKNLGLYGERIGCLTIVLGEGQEEHAERIRSQLILIVRAMYISPPKHGGEIVSAVLSSDENMKEWQKCLKVMVHRCKSIRHGLKERLQNLGTPGNWDHITSQIGMFSYMGLTPQQVEHLAKEHHIYMLSNGRANMYGLNKTNIDRVAEAIHKTILKIPA